MQQYQEKILTFIQEIGLPIAEKKITEKTFLPGIQVEAGALVYDPAGLLYPGDLLHEAGHLAVLPSALRQTLHGDVGNDGGYEMAAIAWSYAAAVHLNVPVDVLFHAQGYKGGAQALVENFQQGCYIGVPMLVWLGLARQSRPAHPSTDYPVMQKWLCD